jgi:hypothetical protein
MRMWQCVLLLIGFVLSGSTQNPVKHKNGIVDVPSNTPLMRLWTK